MMRMSDDDDDDDEDEYDDDDEDEDRNKPIKLTRIGFGGCIVCKASFKSYLSFCTTSFLYYPVCAPLWKLGVVGAWHSCK
eukprot:1168117-Amphidinium_carterae.2